MAQIETQKTLSLLIAALVIAIFCAPQPSLQCVGLSTHSGLLSRLVYHFFHTSVFHLALNLVCFLQVMFYFRIPLLALGLAYFSAAVAPELVITDTPTVGLSAIVYFLFGFILWQVRSKFSYQCWMLAYFTFGILHPYINGALHVYSYIIGIGCGLLPLDGKRYAYRP